MTKDQVMDTGDVAIQVGDDDDEEEEDNLVGLVMDDEGDVRLQGLFHFDNDGSKGEEESNDFGVNRSGNNNTRKRKISEKRKKLLIHENSILDCFHLAVASHNAANSHQTSIIQQKGDDSVALSQSYATSTRSDSFRWRPPLLYAHTESDTPDASAAGTLADWQPHPLELPQWALDLVRPGNESSQNKQQDKQE
jgi:hypothetical protein